MQSTQHDGHDATGRSDRTLSATILTATAFLLTAAVIFAAGQLPSNPAYADATTTANGFTVFTASSGFGADTRPYQFFYVIDNRSETMLVYEIPQAAEKRIVLRSGANLRSLFGAGRNR